MRIFVAGATGALGRHLIPRLVAVGHEVTATTRTPGKLAQLREAGAEPAVVDGLDREGVIAAALAAAPVLTARLAPRISCSMLCGSGRCR
jgi:2-alkyl-3-oxoalkanoate reductase